jgi:bridging integrator 3
MTAAQTRIAETIDAFYGEAGTSDNVSAYYRQAVEDLDAETVKELVPPPLPNETLLFFPWQR